MASLSPDYDLLYNCESQYRKNYPTIDYKKNLWLYSIDNFIVFNRHNGESMAFEIPDAAKFVMVASTKSSN